MNEALSRLISFYQDLSPDTLGRVGEIYALDARFVDPFNDVRGCEAITRIFEHMFAQLDSPEFIVLESYVDWPRAMLLWRFKFRFKGRRGEHAVEGVTRLLFDDTGRVCDHCDYWDAAGELYAKLPLVGGLFRALKRRLAPPS